MVNPAKSAPKTAQPGFRQIETPETILSPPPTTVTPSPQKATTFSLPPTALTSIIDHLVHDACQATHKEKSCNNKCSFSEQPWSKELRNVSMGNKQLRGLVWGRKMEKIVVRGKEGVGRLKRIGMTDRDKIRTIIIEMPKFKRNLAAPTPSTNAAFVSQLNPFLASCKSLHRLVDVNNHIQAPILDPQTDDLAHSTVKELHIDFPCTGYHQHPLHSTHPAVEHLVLVESEPHLFGDHTKQPVWKDFNPLDYFQSFFGTESPQIKELTIKARLPDELKNGDWKKIRAKMSFKEMLEHLPELRRVNIRFEVPFTRNGNQACMTPYILESLAKSELPLQQIHIIADGTCHRRMMKAFARIQAPGDPIGMLRESIDLSVVVPTDAVLRSALKAKRSKLPQLEVFSLVYDDLVHDMDDMEGREPGSGIPAKWKTLRHYSAKMVWADPDNAGPSVPRMTESSETDTQGIKKAEEYNAFIQIMMFTGCLSAPIHPIHTPDIFRCQRDDEVFAEYGKGFAPRTRGVSFERLEKAMKSGKLHRRLQSPDVDLVEMFGSDSEEFDPGGKHKSGNSAGGTSTGGSRSTVGGSASGGPLPFHNGPFGMNYKPGATSSSGSHKAEAQKTSQSSEAKPNVKGKGKAKATGTNQDQCQGGAGQNGKGKVGRSKAAKNKEAK